MTDMQATAQGGSSATLSTDGSPPPEPPPPEDTTGVEDQWSAVINCHDSTMAQVEVALAGNAHTLDPFPGDPTRRVRRHPVYLVAVDYGQRDDEGRPAPGAPLEMDLEALRGVFSARYPYLSPDAPPLDGSHIHVTGMRFVAELDSAGNPTGGVVAAPETETEV